VRSRPEVLVCLCHDTTRGIACPIHGEQRAGPVPVPVVGSATHLPCTREIASLQKERDDARTDLEVAARWINDLRDALDCALWRMRLLHNMRLDGAGETERIDLSKPINVGRDAMHGKPLLDGKY
jgi:hypothetical protein